MIDNAVDMLAVLLLAALLVSILIALCRVAAIADATDRALAPARQQHYSACDDFAARLAQRNEALDQMGAEADNVFPLDRGRDAEIIQFPGGAAA